MVRKLNDMAIKQALGIMMNKIFFKGGLKVKDNPETKKKCKRFIKSSCIYSKKY